MKADLASHNFRFNNVSYHCDHQIDQQQPQCQRIVPLQGCNHSPGDHDTTCAQYRKNIEHRNDKGDDQSIVDTDEGQANNELNKGNAHDERIGADTHKECSHHVFLDLNKNCPGLSI